MRGNWGEELQVRLETLMWDIAGRRHKGSASDDGHTS